jgi:alkanesulfonate monooxygenase SsuD/methylene tetrahydromethanopterin reductase-like flavin-dependent oxidoreductase (luciferase family)
MYAEGITAGIVLREEDMAGHRGRLGALAEDAVAAGIDHLTVGDHVSFGGGHGADGLVQATALLASHPTVAVQTGVYLLSIRHPAPVARQLATIAMLAPGRFTFGVGVGGDDPRELELCGVDPRTRGRRTTEALALVRALLAGQPVDFAGRHFRVRDGLIRPAPTPPIPVLVGGRSDAALERARSLGDGWIGVWVSPRRFAEALERIGRDGLHTLQLWAGFDRSSARTRRVMEDSYGLPFERFARYTPCGGPDDVAAALAPYVEAGCRRFNFVPVAESLESAIADVAAVKTLLTRAFARQGQ